MNAVVRGRFDGQIAIKFRKRPVQRFDLRAAERNRGGGETAVGVEPRLDAKATERFEVRKTKRVKGTKRVKDGCFYFLFDFN